MSNCWLNGNRAEYTERCTFGSRRGLRKPSAERRKGGAFLLYRLDYLKPSVSRPNTVIGETS